MKFLFLIVCLLFCEDLEVLLRKRLAEEKFEPVSNDFFQNNYNILFIISFKNKKLYCTRDTIKYGKLECILSSEHGNYNGYNSLSRKKNNAIKEFIFCKSYTKMSYIQFKGFNLYDIKFHNFRKVILNEIKSNQSLLSIIPDLNYFSDDISNWNLLALDDDYQPVIYIPCIKDGRLDTIKIPGKDLNLVDHLKNNLLQVIKYDIDQEKFNKFFDNFDFVKFEYFNKIKDIGLINNSIICYEMIKDKYRIINECLDCDQNNMCNECNKKIKQNQDLKDILSKFKKFIDEFLNITSAKACAIMILYNTLSKDTIRDIIGRITSNTSSFYYKAFIFWLKNNTPRLPLEFNKKGNNKTLNYKSLIFKKKLTYKEAEKIQKFYNILAECEFITVSNMDELFYAFIICKAYAENYHPRLLINNPFIRNIKEFLGFNQPPLNVLETFYTLFKDYKKLLNAINIKGKNSVYGIIKRETEERLKNKK